MSRHYSTHEMVSILHDKALPKAVAKFIERLHQMDQLGEITLITDEEIEMLDDVFGIYNVGRN